MSREEDAVERMSDENMRSMAGGLCAIIEFVMCSASCGRLTALHVVMAALASQEREWSQGSGVSLEPSDN